MILGAVAQLGERLNGIQEVRGSIPLSSTKESTDLAKAKSFLLRDGGSEQTGMGRASGGLLAAAAGLVALVFGSASRRRRRRF